MEAPDRLPESRPLGGAKSGIELGFFLPAQNRLEGDVRGARCFFGSAERPERRISLCWKQAERRLRAKIRLGFAAKLGPSS